MNTADPETRAEREALLRDVASVLPSYADRRPDSPYFRAGISNYEEFDSHLRKALAAIRASIFGGTRGTGGTALPGILTMPAAPEDPGRDGRVVTFYSYKGGTGRSMALANVAWILAAAGERVLVIDWDLEAPGLHRYFRPFLLDKDITGSDGLIDFVTDYCAETMKVLDASLEPEPIPPGRPFHEVEHFDAGRLPAEPVVPPARRELPPGWYAEKADLFYYKSSLTYRFPVKGSSISSLPGRQGASYPDRVNSSTGCSFTTDMVEAS